MNRKQWTVLLAGIVLFGLSELFPPWVYEDKSTSAKRPAGYHFFNEKPKVKSPAEMRAIFELRPNEPTRFTWAVHRNLLRLFIQRCFLIAVTPGLILAFANRRSLIKLLFAGFFLLVALFFFAVFVFDVWTMW